MRGSGCGEAAWYDGRPSTDDYLPFFACKAAGDVLWKVAKSNPKCPILVLCGHTPGGGQVRFENLQGRWATKRIS